MRRSIALAATAATLLLAATACGPDSGNAATPTGGGNIAASAGPADPGTSSAPAATGVTPDALCGLISLDEMGQATGATYTATEKSTSGDVSNCSFIGAGSDGYSASKVIIEYQPTARTAIDYTKANGTPVPGLGAEAYFFKIAGNLEVILTADGTACFGVYIEDVRLHNNNPQAAATEIAQIVVPKLLHQ